MKPAEFIVHSQLYPAPRTPYSVASIANQCGGVVADVPCRHRPGGRVPCVVIPGELPFCVVYSHANGEDLVDAVSILEILRNRFRCWLVSYEYSGYYTPAEGVRPGTPSERACEANLYADAECVASAVRTMVPLGAPVISLGRSLGCAMAVRVAATMNPPAAGLVLVSPFATVFSTKLKGLVRRALRSLDLFPVVERVGNPALEATPLMVVHGDADRLVPCELGREVFEAAVARAKTIRVISGATHNSVLNTHLEELLNHLERFMRENGVMRAPAYQI